MTIYAQISWPHLFHVYKITYRLAKVSCMGAFTYDVSSRGGRGFEILTVVDKGGGGGGGELV